MKNLKKVLALVLALATVLGLGVTASAKEYTDAGSIEYTEAVEVMSMIDILSGNPDGSFNPQGNLTRAQAAKMVSFLLNSGKDVNELYAGSCQFTDCYSNWAKGYIAYVNQMGIVSGVGNGKFNPNGTLTGVQLAKMMLTSLGYDAKVEGYQGSDSWQVNIINDAQAAGLLKGMDDVNLYNAITREQAAQMMFNALKADMVNYESKGTEIELPGLGTIVTGASDAKPIEVTNDADNYAGVGTEGNRPAGYGYKQLCEKYFSKLELGSGTDAFGRTGNEWTYTKDSVETTSAVYAAAPDYSIVVSETGKNANEWAEKANKKLSVAGGNAVLVNGQDSQAATVDLQVGDIVEFSNVTTAANGDKTAANVYVIRYTADVIEEVDTDVSKTDAEDGVSAYITFENAGKINNTDIVGYNASTYVEGAVVGMVTDTNSDSETVAIASYVANSVEGAITAYTANTYTINGTKYTAVSDNMLSNIDFKEGSYKLYLDPNGYVIKAEVVEGTANVGDMFYVASVWTEESKAYNETTTTFYAQTVSMDGTVKDVEVAQVEASLANSHGNDLVTDVNTYVTGLENEFCTTTVHKVTKGSDTVKVSLSDWDESKVNLSVGDIDFNEDDTIKTDATKLGTYYLNSKTVYVVMEGTGSKLNVTTKTGGLSFTATDDTDAAKVIYTTESGSKVANYVVITTGEYVTADTGDYIYIADGTKGANVAGGYAYSVYNMDGKKIDIVVKDATSVEAAGFYTYTTDADGLYILSDKISDTTVEESAVYTSYYNNLLTSTEFVDFDCANAVIVDTHDSDDYSKTVTTLAAMQTAKKAGYVVTFDAVVDVTNKEVDFIVVTGVKYANSSVSDAITNGTAGVNGDFIADITVNGNAVTVSAESNYTSAEDGGVKAISGDLARYLGALYNVAKVSKIEYDGQTYLWCADKGLASSNWTLNGANSADTLVKAITDDWKGADTEWGNDDPAYVATLTVDGVRMTYTVNVAEAE